MKQELTVKGKLNRWGEGERERWMEMHLNKYCENVSSDVTV